MTPLLFVVLVCKKELEETVERERNLILSLSREIVEAEKEAGLEMSELTLVSISVLILKFY